MLTSACNLIPDANDKNNDDDNGGIVGFANGEEPPGVFPADGTVPEAPRIISVTVDATIQNGDPLNVSFTFADDQADVSTANFGIAGESSFYQVSLVGLASGMTNGTIDLTLSPKNYAPGNYYLALSLEDAAGNVSKATATPFSILNPDGTLLDDTDTDIGTDSGVEETGGTTSTNPVVEFPLSATDKETTVKLTDGLWVTIPPGLILSETTLTVQSGPTMPHPLSEPLDLLGSYALKLGNTSQFESPITVRFPYDESVLEPALEEGKGLFVAYWDENNEAWITVPFEVDTEENKLVVQTDHFSTWIYWTIRGYRSVATAEGHFDIYYNPTETMPLTGSALDMEGFATQVGEQMEIAYGRYSAAGFDMPSYWTTSTIKVIMTVDTRWAWQTWKLGGYNRLHENQTDASFLAPLSGNIILPLSRLTTLDEVRILGAHELFHAVQNQYFNIARMLSNLWWIEGTPDFAAYDVAWQRSIPRSRFHEPTPADYFDDPLTLNDSDHAYQMVRFLEWLARGGAPDWGQCSIPSPPSCGTFRATSPAPSTRSSDDRAVSFSVSMTVSS